MLADNNVNNIKQRHEKRLRKEIRNIAPQAIVNQQIGCSLLIIIGHVGWTEWDRIINPTQSDVCLPK